MQRTCTAEQADASFVMRIAFQSSVSRIDIRIHRAAQCSQNRLFDNANHLANGFDIGFTGSRKASVQRVDSRSFQSLCDAQLFVRFQSRAGHLLSVAQRCVTEQDDT